MFPSVSRNRSVYFTFSSVQLLSRVWLFVTTWTAVYQASLSITNSQSLLKLIPLSQWFHPAISSSVIPFSSCLPSFPASGSFQNESVLHIRWPKYWSFSFRISPSNEYSGLVSFRMVLLDLLAVQGTLKSLLQHHSSKASIFRCSAFFIVQLSHPYMTTAKTIFYFTECLLCARLCPKSCINIIWVNPHNISMR